MPGKLEPVAHSIGPSVIGEGRVCRTATCKMYVCQSVVANTVDAVLLDVFLPLGTVQLKPLCTDLCRYCSSTLLA